MVRRINKEGGFAGNRSSIDSLEQRFAAASAKIDLACIEVDLS